MSILFSGCVSLFRNAETDNNSDKRTAETIIAAIDQYHLDHGNFPESLDILAPDYLSIIPITSRGGDFMYRSFRDWDIGDNYELCFFDDTSKSTQYGCCYSWWFDTPPYRDGWVCTLWAE